MKKLLFMVMAAILCTWNVQAQTEKGDMAVGGNLTMGFGDSYTNFGIGAKFQYNVIDRLRLEPTANYYFKSDYMSMWDLALNVHYLFPLTDRFSFYPLAGLGVVGAKLDIEGAVDDWVDDYLGDEYDDYTVTNFAVHLGAGTEYMVSSNVSLNLEYKYKFCSDLNRSLLSLGVAYHF